MAEIHLFSPQVERVFTALQADATRAMRKPGQSYLPTDSVDLQQYESRRSVLKGEKHKIVQASFNRVAARLKSAECLYFTTEVMSLAGVSFQDDGAGNPFEFDLSLLYLRDRAMDLHQDRLAGLSPSAQLRYLKHNGERLSRLSMGSHMKGFFHRNESSLRESARTAFGNGKLVDRLWHQLVDDYRNMRGEYVAS